MLTEKMKKSLGKRGMTRRHFELIADTLNKYGDRRPLTGGTHLDLCEHFADVLAATNPGFDRARFLKACGIE